ncbi:hypothetical protein V493_03628 [Pseudogymnoascus sp. VKM F-4281 (FW-2241)]|nr:hypothetical protein V493_03628 [Pseudogymnoascus sp. VKM F-4281 (FW-2241)]
MAGLWWRNSRQTGRSYIVTSIKPVPPPPPLLARRLTTLSTLLDGGVLPGPQLHSRHQQRHPRHRASKRDDRPSHGPPPVLLLAQLEVAQRWEDVRQNTRGRRADDLEHRAEITHLRRDERRAPDQPGGQRHMDRGACLVGGGVKRICGRGVGSGGGGKEIHHDLSAHEGFEGEGGEHVQPEAKAGDVDERGGGKVVEYVAVGEGTEGEEPGEAHSQTSNERYDSANVSKEGEAGESWRG